MLDKKIDEIITDGEGKFIGVRSGDETVKAKQVIGDPSYFGAGKTADGGKLRVVEDGKVVRAICLLKHPIPGTDDSDSVQIIIPQNQVNRRNGAFLCLCILFHQRSTGIQISTLLWYLQLTASVRKTSISLSSARSSRRSIPNKKLHLVFNF
jgi:RAB protein geranylgeranyltransferase component A